MTPRQRRFVEEYLVDLNAHQAALRAGFAPRSARQTVTKLLRRPDVAAAIQERMEERSRRTAITADRVLAELACIAFSDMRHFIQWGPEGITLIPPEALAPGETGAIAEIRGSSEPRGPRLKLHSKERALDALGRHLGLFRRSRAPR